MTAKSDEKAHDLIRQRGIDMILVSNDPNERKYYSSASQGIYLFMTISKRTIIRIG